MPSSLHDDLAQAAAAEGVSLNQYICTTLAGAVQWQSRDPPPRSVRQTRDDISWDLWIERHRGRRRAS